MMTGSIMRSSSCWTVLSSVLAAFFLTLKADSDECSPAVMVRRNTNYTVHSGAELRVECPVEFCSSSPPTVSWIKQGENYVRLNVTVNSRIRTEWKTCKQHHGVSNLIFLNVLKHDSGTYQCESEGSQSHNIYIIVKDHAKNNDTSTEKTHVTTATNQTEDSIMIYVYCAAGTASFIIVVILVSVVSMRGCKGKPKPETQPDNQYVEVPMAERLSTQASSLQPSPRGSPNLLPSRRSSERKRAGLPDELTSGNNEHLYEQKKQNRHREKKAAPPEDGRSVVYAALNHEAPARTAARPQRTVEETEYAAIRLV